MNALQDKRVILGISGGIAAYKGAALARRLIEGGATVRVVMTQGALAFVQPMTFQALTAQAVHTTLLNPDAEAAMGHIELARWADLILIAPASANVLARLAHGMADDLLSTLCLASEAPIYVAPAMNRVMWSAAATVGNCQILRERGVSFIGPDEGIQACGETGAGRLLEPEAIYQTLIDMRGAHMTRRGHEQQRTSQLLAGKTVLVTAGPTREAIDPVRYISNHSSGKMGFAVATAARSMGANVILVSGPVSLASPSDVTRVDVVTAQQMLDAVLEHSAKADIFISVAAVSDYRLEQIANEKIKKIDDQVQLSLVKNPDILKKVASLQTDRPFCVGFAAETHQIEVHALTKLREKNLDMIAANQVATSENPVFGTDHNALEVYWHGEGGHTTINSARKSDVAFSLLELVSQRMQTAGAPNIQRKPDSNDSTQAATS